MTPDLFIPIIVGILGLLGGTGFWGYRQSRKEAPVKKRDADIAIADKSVQMALAVATAAREDNATLRKSVAEERTQRETLTTRVDGLETHIREQDRTIRNLRDTVRVFTDWANDIVTRWNVIRLQTEPPQLPRTRTD